MANLQINRSLPVLFGLLIVITIAQRLQTLGTIVFNASSTTGESYYIGQPLTITCKPELRILGFFGVVLDNHSQTIYARCEGVFLDSGLLAAAAPTNLQIGINYKHSCNSNPLSTTTIIFTISKELAAYRLRCIHVYFGSVSSSSLRIGAETVKEPPQNLVMSFSPERIIENQTLTVTCSSSSSQSSYIYGVVKEDAVTIIPEGKYIPSVRDRGGFSVKCTDTANEDWRVISAADVEVKTEVFPRYITRNWTHADYRELNVISNNHSIISCDIEGHPTPTYTWTSNVSNFEAVTGKKLLIPKNSRKRVHLEKITCTASVDGVTSLEPMLITWIMKWYHPRTNPPQIKPPSTSSGAVIFGTVVFNASTTTGESYYIGQPLIVTCKQSEFGVAFVGVVLDDHSQAIYARCEGVFSNFGLLSAVAPQKLPIGIKYVHSCDAFPQSTTTIIFTISKELAAYRLRCFYVHDGSVSSSSLHIGAETVKEPPQHLVMSFSPEQIVENQTLTVTCSSSSSQSSYIYQVAKENTVTRIPEGKYTTSEKDRDGFSVKCIDTANEAWRVISADDVEVTTEVFPRYITRNWTLAVYRELNMISTNHSTISCDIEGHPTPTYTWTSSVSNFEAVTGKNLLIPMNSRKSVHLEKITCTASVDGVTPPQPTLITWTIKWHHPPTNPPQTKPPQTSSAAAICGAVAACIIVIVIIILVWWKKGKGAGFSPEKHGRLRRKMLKSKSVAPTETVRPHNHP